MRGVTPDEPAKISLELQDVLHKLDEPSLSALVHDHEHGHLENKIAQHA